jgi:hypothetical protein
MRDKQGWHLRIVHSNPEPVAGDARLCHLKDRAANPVPVSDTDLIIRKTFNSEILSELPVLEVVPAEDVLPISIGVELICHHGAVFTTMALEIPLAIAIQIQSPGKDTVGHGTFRDGGTNYLALPFDFARKADVDR